jgi:hypothetical protein
MHKKWEIIESSIARIVLRKAYNHDEFIPIVKFNRDSFSRQASLKLVEQSEGVTLSCKIDVNKRSIPLYTITTLPGSIVLPCCVEKGVGTWNADSFVEAVIEPPTSDVQFTSGNTFKVKCEQQFQLSLNITGHKDRSFSIKFYANNDSEHYNHSELENFFCGRIDFTILGSSAVGFRLIENIDALPQAPVEYHHPESETNDPSDIKLSQEQANLYNDCLGVCYATSASRAQQAYIDITGSGVIDLTVSNKNIDHRIASTVGGNDLYMGYGAGGPFALHGYGRAVDNDGVWNGELKRGALLQLWHSTDIKNLYSKGGHSGIFRNYLYDDNGMINVIQYTDYHGGLRNWKKIKCIEKTILGVNLLDVKS